MKQLYPFVLFCLCTSCTVRLNYLGSSAAPVSKVDVFVDASAIQRPYTIMGKGYLEASYYARGKVNKMQAQAVETAKRKGADAVLFQEYLIKRESTGIRTVTRSDSVGKGLVTVQSGTVGPVVSTHTDILFLKYR